MAASEAPAPSGLMTLLRIIGGAVRAVAAKVTRTRRAAPTPASVAGEGETVSPPVQAFIDAMKLMASEFTAAMEAEAARKAAEAGDMFPESDEDAMRALWHATGIWVLSTSQRAELARYLRDHAATLVLLAEEFPLRQALLGEQVKARCLAWRRFSASLFALQHESQKIDGIPVLPIRGTCALFVTIS